MKKIFLLFLIVVALLAPGISKAQNYPIPNGSFENWSSQTAPLNWTVKTGAVEEITEVKWYTTDGQGNKKYYGAPPHEGSEAIEMYGTDSVCEIYQKFPLTGRPPYWSMNFSYFPSVQNDQFLVAFIFTKWNALKASKHDTILVQPLQSNGTYVLPWATIVNASLTSYYNPKLPGNEMPDTGIIVIINSYLGGVSPLFVDRIWFSNSAITTPTDTTVTTGIDENGFQDQSGISAYPNPFSGKTTIHYNLTQSGEVSLNVFDIDGRQVAALVNGNQESGPHDAIFDATALKNGVYFYRLQSGNDVQTGKLMLAR